MLAHIPSQWEDTVKELHRTNAASLTEGLMAEYGSKQFFEKFERFRQFGEIPFSFAPQHFAFLSQIRDAYVAGAFFPAVVAATVFGERLLNEMTARLKKYYAPHPKYAAAIAQDRIVKWDIMRAVLRDWKVTDEATDNAFGDLYKVRQASIHFAPSLDKRLPVLAQRANDAVRTIISRQFGFQGRHPWRLFIPGCLFVSGQYADDPFVREFVTPVAHLVGPYHYLETTRGGFVLHDRSDYADRWIDDDQYSALFQQFSPSKPLPDQGILQ